MCCPVCFQKPTKYFSFDCKHHFCLECIVKMNLICPLCRQESSGYSVDHEYTSLATKKNKINVEIVSGLFIYNTELHQNQKFTAGTCSVIYD